MSRKKEERREKNAIYSGHLRFCLQPRAAYALRSDQDYDEHLLTMTTLKIDLYQEQPPTMDDLSKFIIF